MKFVMFVTGLALSLNAFAWTPKKPVDVVIGFAPGSGNEVSFRIVSSQVEKDNPGVRFVINTKPGSDGVIALNEFIKQPNDGYHINVPSHTGIWVTSDFFYPQIKKFSLDDFEYVISIAKSPLAIIVNEKSTINSPEDFIKYLKSGGDKFVAAGSGAHKLAADYTADYLNLPDNKLTTITYKGPSQAGLGVAAGDVETGIIPLAIAASLAKSGKIKIIGICGEFPIKGFEQTPLMNKHIKGLNVYAGWGLILPKNTPKEVVDWYVVNFVKAINSEEVKVKLEQNFMFTDSREHTPEGFKNSMMHLRKQWVPILEKITK